MIRLTLMKKYMAWGLCIALTLAATACGGKAKAKKNARSISTMQTEYIDACAEKDYDKARGIVEKMIPLYDGDDPEVAKHLKYINEKEIYN